MSMVVGMGGGHVMHVRGSWNGGGHAMHVRGSWGGGTSILNMLFIVL